MTQITINIEDKSMVPHLKKILSAIEGVSIAKPSKTVRKNGIERAMDDVKSGRGRNNVLIPTLVDYTTAAVGYASLARGLLFSKRLQRYLVAIGDLRVVGHCKP